MTSLASVEYEERSVVTILPSAVAGAPIKPCLKKEKDQSLENEASFKLTLHPTVGSASVISVRCTHPH